MSEPITQVEPKEIEQLGPDALVRLLHRLLHCEARDRQIQNPGILVPFQINVPDGGRDGRWNYDVGPDEFIPRSLTFYQCKAEHITEAMCRDEMLVEHKDKATKVVSLHVKERVREVLSAGGCYAFFCSKHEIKPTQQKELDSVARAELLRAGFTPTNGALIEFFGCNRIADWVNRFPAAVRFVREETKGFGGIHYFTVDGWSRLKRVSGRFFGNAALDQKIKSLREALAAGKVRILRVIGLSGVGKTRLVFEALRSTHGADVALRSITAASVYASYADLGNQVVTLVAHLADNGYSGVIVVDDCPPSIHDRLVNYVADSRLSLVTLFHQPEPARNDTMVLTMEPEEMGDVVENILREDAALLARGEEAIKAVASFAQGFPQIARLIAEFHRAPTLAELRDREPLFQKLLSAGENPDPATLATMQALAMFRTIGGAATLLEKQLEAIRKVFCPDVEELAFRRTIEKQKNRDVVQQIADTVMVVPRPLAVALAADLIQFFPAERWKETFSQLASGGLLSDFARRIEELELSDKADAIGELLLKSGVPFGDAEYLLTGTAGSRMFRALSVLNPLVAMKVARRALSGTPLETLRAATEARRDIVRALEVLSWSPETFADAARVLLRLAAAENEGWANNATGVLKQLFSLYLSGTQTPASERLFVLREAIQAPEPEVRAVAISTVGAGLHFGHYSRIGDITLGGKRDARRDWRPANKREELNYWKECYSILRTIITAGGQDAEAAKRALGSSFAAVVRTPLVEELESDFRDLAYYLHGLWPEVKDQIKTVLDLDADLPPAQKAALERWKSYLVPPTAALEDRLRDMVSRPGWHHRKEANGTYIDLSAVDAQRLADEVIEENWDLRPYLHQLLLGEQQQAYTFGAALGKSYQLVHELVDAALELWPNLDTKFRTPALLSGVAKGLAEAPLKRAALLEHLANNPKLIDLLVPLSASIDRMEEADLVRIRDAIISRRLDVWMLRYLIPGQPMRLLNDTFLEEELLKMFQARADAAQVLFEVLWMHCHGEPAKFKRFSPLFQTLLLSKGLPIFDSHLGWEWHETAKRLIADSNDPRWLKRVAEYILNTLLERKSWMGADFMSEVATSLLVKAPTETWAVFGEALRSGDELARFIIAGFLGSTGSKFDNTESLLWKVPVEEFREWIRQNRELAPLLVETMSLYTVETRDETEIFHWHPYALLLLKEASNVHEETLAQELAANLLSFGSTGSRVPYLEKRLALAEELASDQDFRLKRVGEVVGERIRNQIDAVRRAELNEQARFR